MKIWLPAAMGYALGIGALGVTIKVALRTVEWPVLLLSVALAQVILTDVAVRARLNPSSPMSPFAWRAVAAHVFTRASVRAESN